MPQGYSIAVVDGHWLSRAQFEGGNSAKGFMAKLVWLKNEFKPASLAVVWDAPPNTYVGRKVLSGSYKGTRAPPPQEYLDEVASLKAGLQHFAVDQHCGPGEGDDAAATIARTFPGRHLLYSVDKDWIQLVTRDTDLLKGDKLVTVENCKEGFGLPPTSWRAMLAIAGDSSDNVPGVPGLGLVKAKAILSACPYAAEAVIDGKGKELVEKLAADEATAKVAAMVAKMEEHRYMLSVSYSLVGLYQIRLGKRTGKPDRDRAHAWLNSRRAGGLMREAWASLGGKNAE